MSSATVFTDREYSPFCSTSIIPFTIRIIARAEAKCSSEMRDSTPELGGILQASFILIWNSVKVAVDSTATGTLEARPFHDFTI